MPRLVLIGAASVALALALPAAVSADATLTYQTEDWQFEADPSLATQQDVELVGRNIQTCTDELKRLIHYRPAAGTRFRWQWLVGGGPGSWAFPTGVESHYPNSTTYRLIGDPVVRQMAESRLARGTCFGPHEVTHVLTWESWHMSWANEGFATFTDWLYQTAAWKYGNPIQTPYDCDATGWTDGVRYTPYSDIRAFRVTYDMYATAGCFWLEVERRGGFPAIRRILTRLRATSVSTVGDLVVNHVNPVLGIDFRPIARRYGFTDADLTAAGPPPPDPPAPALAMTAITPVAAARAGRSFRVAYAVARSDTGDPPVGATVTCSGRLGTKALRLSTRTFAGGAASCVWLLPKTARGQTLRTTVSVEELGVRAEARASTRVR